MKSFEKVLNKQIFLDEPEHVLTRQELSDAGKDSAFEKLTGSCTLNACNISFAITLIYENESSSIGERKLHLKRESIRSNTLLFWQDSNINRNNGNNSKNRCH